jgi:hypothetical protein
MLPAEKIVERNWVEERKRQKPSNKTAMVPERKNKALAAFRDNQKWEGTSGGVTEAGCLSNKLKPFLITIT